MLGTIHPDERVRAGATDMPAHLQGVGAYLFQPLSQMGSGVLAAHPCKSIYGQDLFGSTHESVAAATLWCQPPRSPDAAPGLRDDQAPCGVVVGAVANRGPAACFDAGPVGEHHPTFDHPVVQLAALLGGQIRAGKQLRGTGLGAVEVASRRQDVDLVLQRFRVP